MHSRVGQRERNLPKRDLDWIELIMERSVPHTDGVNVAMGRIAYSEYLAGYTTTVSEELTGKDERTEG